MSEEMQLYEVIILLSFFFCCGFLPLCLVVGFLILEEDIKIILKWLWGKIRAKLY